MTMVRSPLVIGERFVDADGKGGQSSVHDPADQQVIGHAPLADAATVDAAVAAAAEALPAWAKLPATRRAGYLLEIASFLRHEATRLGPLLTLEQGKPLSEAMGEVAAAAKAFEYYAAEAQRVYGQTIPTDSPTLRSLVVRQPIGVVAAIATWNYPLGLMAWKIAPALAAGCTVVAKPAEETPLAVLELVAGARRLGLPPGVLNSLNGPGEGVGDRLAAHEQVAKISFTGATATGKRLLAIAAEQVKSVTLELGGHSPMIVCADAPLELAVADGVKRSFRNAGQLCNSVNRIFVVRSVATPFIERFSARAAELVVGRGLSDPEPDLGPLTNARTLARVEEHVADARRRGAEVPVGGARPDGEATAKGFYYLPTVVVGGDDLVMVHEETFGPVAPIVVVEDEDEAIGKANALELGLVCYLYTKDLRRTFEAAERLEFGTVDVNNVGGGDVAYPYAGWKQSGLGLELGPQGLDAYLRTKHVRIEIGYS